jgi:CRISPR-associated protein (TIGR03984 family)
MFHNVEIGLWKDNGISLHDNDFSWDSLVELRVFDANSEFRMVRAGAGFSERYIDDEEKLPKDTFTRDTAYSLYGEDVDKSDNFGIALTETRGKELWFPKSIEFGDNIVAMRLKIRHYGRTNPSPTDSAPDKPGIEIFDFRFAGFEYWSQTDKFEEVRLDA